MATAPRLRILLMGSPGSGKGTLTKKLLARFGAGPGAPGAAPTSPALVALSSGDLLRQHLLHPTTPLGQEIQGHVNAGTLLPDQLMTRLMLQELGTPTLRAGNWLLDGFPRTLAQAQALDAFLADTPGQAPLSLLLHLVVPQAVILERITSRWIHPASGRTYHLAYSPPRVPGRDDVTGEALVQRSDDTVDILRARLEAYDRMTLPLLAYYAQARGMRVCTLAGNTSDEIYPKMEAAVAEVLRAGSSAQ